MFYYKWLAKPSKSLVSRIYFNKELCKARLNLDIPCLEQGDSSQLSTFSTSQLYWVQIFLYIMLQFMQYNIFHIFSLKYFLCCWQRCRKIHFLFTLFTLFLDYSLYFALRWIGGFLFRNRLSKDIFIIL